MRSLILILFTPLLLIACSISEDKSIAETEVIPFHDRLDSGQFDYIYDASSREMKDSTSKQDLVSFLGAIHKKLGKVEKVTPQGSMVTVNTSGKFVQLQYQTTFEEGTATEIFYFRLEDHRALLAGYHINSMALITK